jgi:hypothetical protein
MLVTLALIVPMVLGAVGAGPTHAGSASRRPSPQPQASARGDRVTLLLVEALARPGSAAEVRRNGAGAKSPVIALKRSALSPELVAAAFTANARAIERLGKTARITAYISDQMPLRRVAGAERARLQLIVEQLRRAAPAEIPGLGRGRAITVTTEDGSSHSRTATS